INLLIYIVILLGVPSLLIIGISFIKPTIKEKTSFYLYAFSSAVFIMIGTLGLLKESFEGSSEFVESLHESSEIETKLISIGIIVGGALIGLVIVVLFRYLFVKKVGEIHSLHENHSHSDHIVNVKDIDNPKAAWLVIFLILSHRTIDGFVLGGYVAKVSVGIPANLGIVITFNLHIIIEVIIIYYRQIQFGEKRWKATLYNFYTLLALVPIMFLGAYINKYLDKIGWILPLTNASGGAIITFVGIIELVPEFLHNKKMIAKEWYKVIISFGIGIIFTLILLSFDSDAHQESHDSAIESAQTLLRNKINSYNHKILNFLKC
ncbi:MAG: hypothetical protein K2I67_03185, partial [Malacoplasma sp.]|nr:hypothetical protein [Malacoplasma sp.]